MELLAALLIIGILAVIVVPRLGGVKEESYATLLVGDLKTLREAMTLHYARNGSYPIIVCSQATGCPRLPLMALDPNVRVRTYPGIDARRGYYGSAGHKYLPKGQTRCINIGDTAVVAPAGFSNSQQPGHIYFCEADY